MCTSFASIKLSIFSIMFFGGNQRKIVIFTGTLILHGFFFCNEQQPTPWALIQRSSWKLQPFNFHFTLSPASLNYILTNLSCNYCHCKAVSACNVLLSMVNTIAKSRLYGVTMSFIVNLTAYYYAQPLIHGPHHSLTNVAGLVLQAAVSS